MYKGQLRLSLILVESGLIKTPSFLSPAAISHFATAIFFKLPKRSTWAEPTFVTMPISGSQ